MKIAIVGTGPSGISAAYALIHQKFLGEIHLFDPGVTEENSLLDSISSNRRLKGGSDVVYRRFSNSIKVKAKRCDLISTHSPGGFSNVWGASLRNFVDDEYQKKVSRFLERTFIPELNLESSSTPKINEFLKSITLENQSDNWEFKSNILAVYSSFDKHACRQLGECLTGCPNNSIWNSSFAIEDLQKLGIQYYSGLYINRVSKNLDKSQPTLTLEAINHNSEKIKITDFDRVLLACGPLETFAILNKSRAIKGKRKLQQCRTFYLTGFYFGKNSNENRKKGNTFALAQIVGRYKAMKKKEFIVQYYELTKNTLFAYSKNALVSRFYGFLPRVITERMFVGICYLKSSDSNLIEIDFNSNSNTVTCRAEKYPLKEFIKICLSWFSANIELIHRKIITVPIVPIFSKSGKGNHLGNYLTDKDLTKFGELREFQGLFVCDSSSANPLPNGSFTLSLCGHAYNLATNMLSLQK
jgi:ferredoxin